MSELGKRLIAFRNLADYDLPSICTTCIVMTLDLWAMNVAHSVARQLERERRQAVCATTAFEHFWIIFWLMNENNEQADDKLFNRKDDEIVWLNERDRDHLSLWWKFRLNLGNWRGEGKGWGSGERDLWREGSLAKDIKDMNHVGILLKLCLIVQDWCDLLLMA